MSSTLNRRTFLSTAAIAAMGASAAGCSNPKPGGGPGGSLAYTFWDPNFMESSTKLISKFEAKNPKIDVEIAQIPITQYWTRLQTTFTGGNAPDIVTMNGPNFQLYASNDKLMPLDRRIASDDVNLAKYPSNLNELYTYENTQYAIPINFSTIALWYNKNLFDDAGVAYPNEAWTWDDLKDAAERITDQRRGIYGISPGSPISMAQENYYNTILQAGGYIISDDGRHSGFDDKRSIEGLKFWRDFMKEGVSPSYARISETDPTQMFQSGQVAMYYGGSWRAPQWRQANMDAVDLALLPSGPVGRQCTVHGMSYAVAAGSANPHDAWNLLKFLTNQESQALFARAGILIPAHADSQNIWLESMPEYNLNAFIEMLDHAMPYPVSENTQTWQTQAIEILAQAWAGHESMETAAEELAAKMNESLAVEE
ncbi:ABC transporter substrate-binding protein [Arthrobacter castelli]|uniref:ABC transporter substrate-binding protein n=1 Tax=Arthrobacter castelli TaxID=271431 RepID=UPI00040B065E|nr:sugar ABC transporter substrate-binding protein [Arthrobacter castelli]